MVLARVRVPLGIQDGVQRESGIPLHDVGELQARGQKGICEGPPALRAVSHPVKLLSAPVLSDALTAEVVLAAETDRVLINAQTYGTQELVLQTASHLNLQRGRSCTVQGAGRTNPESLNQLGSLSLGNVPGLIPEKERK